MNVRLVFALILLAASPAAGQPADARSSWIALAKGGFVVPAGRTALDMLVEMNPLLASDDPVLRDDVAYTAAERWILREHRLTPADLRTLLQLWTNNLDDGLGTSGRTIASRWRCTPRCAGRMPTAPRWPRGRSTG